MMKYEPIKIHLSTEISFPHYHWAVWKLMCDGRKRITHTMVISFLKDQIQKFGTSPETLFGESYCSDYLTESDQENSSKAFNWALPRWRKIVERRSI